LNYIRKKKSCYDIVKHLDNQITAATVMKIIKENKIPKNNQSEYWTEEKRKLYRQKALNGEIGILSQNHSIKRRTNIEQFFENWCIENGIVYIFQYLIKNNGHRYDFFLPNFNLLVEVDGIFWHNTPEKKLLDKKFEEEANKNGFNLIRFTDKQIEKTKQKCFEKIYEFRQSIEY